MKNVLSLFALLFLFTTSVNAQSDKELAASTVTMEKIKEHIYFLSSDDLKGRDTGSKELDIAADYLADALKSYGAKPVSRSEGYFQTVPLLKVGPPTELSLKVKDMVYTDLVQLYGTKVSYSGKAVFLGYGLEEDFEAHDVKGKLVIVRAGTESGQNPMELFNAIGEKWERAKEKGAVGVVELAPLNPMMWSFLEVNMNTERMVLANSKGEEDFYYTWLRDSDEQIAELLEAEGEFDAGLEIRGGKEEKITSKNVAGIIEGSDPKLKNEYIIYSAHYDHEGIGVPDATGDSIYNGARDNAVGVATLLSLAENISKHPVKRSALFLFFTAEEKGLLGSKYYVENPLLPLEQMVFCLNSDNAGYNDTSLITIFGLGRTTAEEDIKTAATAFGLQAIEDPAPEQNLFERSDNVNFANKGIPAPTFSMGFTSFSGDVVKYYHQPSDEADSLDFDYLYKFFQSYVLAGRLISNNPQTPFWTSGDKYEEKGKELYGKE